MSAPWLSPLVSYVDMTVTEWSLLSALPVLLVCCLLIFRVFSHTRKRPKWLQSFVDEQVHGPKFVAVDEVEKSSPRLPRLLLVLSISGLVTQIIASLLPGEDLEPLPRALTWVTVTQRLPYSFAEINHRP